MSVEQKQAGDNRRGTVGERKEGDKTDGNEKKRYNESKVIIQFLSSKNGIPFLLSFPDRQSFSGKSTHTHSKTVEDQADDLIDFYTTWTSNFPVRKNLKVSKYEFLRTIENFCAKKDINQAFETVINN